MRKALVTASALMSLGLALPAFAQAPTGQEPGQVGAPAAQRDHDEGDEHETMMGGRMLEGMMRGRHMERMMTRVAHELAQGVFYRVKPRR